MRPLVLDTNIVLDVFVFDDAAARALRAALHAGARHWIATAAMRDELARVLHYPQITPRLAHYQLQPDDVLAQFDRCANLTAVPAKASVTCKDADDQKFIDLAVAHGALLLSKDRAVTSMARRVALLGAQIAQALPQPVPHNENLFFTARSS